MPALAQRAHYPHRSAGLGASPMATKPKAATAGAPTLGQQLIKALVPKHFPTMVAPPKLRGALVMHGVGHQAFRREADESNESDAWHLTAALLLPLYETHPLSLSDIIARAWAPEWMVRLVMEQRRGCFLGASEQSSRL